MQWKLFRLFFLFYGQKDHSKICSKNPKTINHNYDVINFYFNEGTQKTFARDHSKLVNKIAFFWIIYAFLCEDAGHLCMNVYRTLWEGQEISRKSNFFARDHFGTYEWISPFLRWNHSTWSFWENLNIFVGYQLISHVIW